MKYVSVLITDLDNTLFDWVEMWHASFSTQLEGIAKKSGVDKDVLIKEFKAIHEKYHSSEYSFAVRELPSLLNKHDRDEIVDIYKSILEDAKNARNAALKMYPGVLETLKDIKLSGALIIGYTESVDFYTKQRIKKLGLDGLLDYVYSPKDHDFPEHVCVDDVRKYSREHYELSNTQIRHTPKESKKPDKEVLQSILNDIQCPPNDAVYVGDDLIKDVKMAQEAGLLDVHAKYGVAHNTQQYELLKKVTHWTDEEVERQKKSHDHVQPTHTIDSFGDLKKLFQFKRFLPSARNDSVAIDIWKKIIDVQQHFNDLELRIRNLAITIITSVVGAAGLLFVNKDYRFVTVCGHQIPSAVIPLCAGFIGILACYVIDHMGYHRLLQGAVNQGLAAEKKLASKYPEILLTHSIKEGSSIKIALGGKVIKIRSGHRIVLFYTFFLFIFAAPVLVMVIKKIPKHFLRHECPLNPSSINSSASGAKTEIVATGKQ